MSVATIPVSKPDFRKFKPSAQLLLPWHPGRSVSTAKAAKLLGCSKDTVLRLIQSGDLEAYKLNFRKATSPYKVRFESIYTFAALVRKHNGLDPIQESMEELLPKTTAGVASGSHGYR